MAVPDFQTLMRPLLARFEDGQEHDIAGVREQLGEEFALSDEELADLIGSVEGLDLPRGIEGSLLAKLDGAQRNLDADDLDGACDKLASFIHKVEAQSGKRIDAADAEDLIDEAAAVQESLGCGAA